jgi:hypothetical protein
VLQHTGFSPDDHIFRHKALCGNRKLLNGANSRANGCNAQAKGI